MLSGILNSDIAIYTNISIMRRLHAQHVRTGANDAAYVGTRSNGVTQLHSVIRFLGLCGVGGWLFLSYIIFINII